MGFTHFKPLKQTLRLPSKFLLQPMEKKSVPRAWLIPPAALQLCLSGPYFSSLAIKKVQGISSGVGITTIRACEVGAAF